VQIHDGRCAAVDIVRLEAVSEKTLHSIRDLSMFVWSRRELWRGREVEVVAFMSSTFTDLAKQSGEGARVLYLMTIWRPMYSLTTELPHLQYLLQYPLTKACPICSTKATSKVVSVRPYKNRSSLLASSDKVRLAFTS
jgi:hypothetical protein